MATKYRTYKFSNGIAPVEVEEETDRYVVIDGIKNTKNHNYSGYKYHNTFGEAKRYLIERTENLIKTLSEQLAVEKANLAKLQQLKK